MDGSTLNNNLLLGSILDDTYMHIWTSMDACMNELYSLFLVWLRGVQ